MRCSVRSLPTQMFYDSMKCFKALQKSFVPCPCFRLNIQCIDLGITLKSPPTLTGEKPDPDQTFKLTSLQNFSSCLPNTCTTLVSNHNISHRQPESVLMETPQDTIVSFAQIIVKSFGKITWFFQLNWKTLIKLYPEYLRTAFYSSGAEQNQPRVLQFQVFLVEFGFFHVLHWLGCDFLGFCPSGVRNCHIVQTGSKQTKNWTEFTGRTCSFEPTNSKVSPWSGQPLSRAQLLLFGVWCRRAAGGENL